MYYNILIVIRCMDLQNKIDILKKFIKFLREHNQNYKNILLKQQKKICEDLDQKLKEVAPIYSIFDNINRINKIQFILQNNMEYQGLINKAEQQIIEYEKKLLLHNTSNPTTPIHNATTTKIPDTPQKTKYTKSNSDTDIRPLSPLDINSLTYEFLEVLE